MKTTKLLLALSIAATLGFTSLAVADNDIDLPINGDFRGAPSGYSPAPGWTLTADGGSARILPTRDRDDFILELYAAPNRSQSVVSNMHQFPGSVLKLEAKISGAGNAALGFEAFDSTGTKLLAADRVAVQVSNYEQKVKRYFRLNTPVACLRVKLTAEAGSRVQFRDVEAEVSGPALIAQVAPPPGAIAAPGAPQPPAPGVIAAPGAPQPGVPPRHHQPRFKPLADEQYLDYATLGHDEHFEASVPVGKDIDFDLSESTSNVWRLVSNDARICRVKIEHDRDGKFNRRRFKAEIELKALRPGNTTVVFASGPKKITIHFTAL